MTHRDSVREAEDDALALWAKEWQLAGHQVTWLGGHKVHVSTRPDSWVRVWREPSRGWWVNGFLPGCGVTIPYSYKTLDRALDVASEYLRTLDVAQDDAREFLRKLSRG